jgi:uncharacterized protein
MTLSRLIRKGRNWLVGTDLIHVEQAVLLEIQQLRVSLPHVAGALVASADGLLVAHDLAEVQAETFAAMSAAQLGLAQQIAGAAGFSEFQETITRTTDGYVATFAAGANALLTVVASSELNVGLLHHEARPVAARVGDLIRPAGMHAHPSPGNTRRENSHGRHGQLAQRSDAD